jgi:two-component system, cell cycle sensor histidine kinase and response regulator CckA
MQYLVGEPECRFNNESLFLKSKQWQASTTKGTAQSDYHRDLCAVENRVWWMRTIYEKKPRRKRALMADLSTDNLTTGSESRLDLQTLLVAQKTELISEITRATANQFNNIMMAITSYAELEMKKASSSQRKNLEQMLSNANRATALVQTLLAISRKQTASPRLFDLNKLLRETSHLTEQLAGDHISVVYKLGLSIPMINADPVEVEQVALSLVINARNAMAKRGELTVSTRLVELAGESIDVDEIDRPGNYVMLSIDDTGHTSSVEDLVDSQDQDARINLSLAVVRGIVKNAGGRVRFSSEPGRGNSFSIFFPTLKMDGQGDPKPRSLRNMPVARTILVVEDDDAVRVPTSEFLKMEGFKVLQARTGEEAVHVVQQNRSCLDVLITDIVMPKMTGRQVAGRLIELHPSLKVLYMSGETDEEHPARVSHAHEAPVLQKPFRLETLKDKIHELLGE